MAFFLKIKNKICFTIIRQVRVCKLQYFQRRLVIVEIVQSEESNQSKVTPHNVYAVSLFILSKFIYYIDFVQGIREQRGQSMFLFSTEEAYSHNGLQTKPFILACVTNNCVSQPLSEH